MFKRGGFDSYDMESSLMRMAEEKLKNLVGVEIRQGDFLQIAIDENKNAAISIRITIINV